MPADGWDTSLAILEVTLMVVFGVLSVPPIRDRWEAAWRELGERVQRARLRREALAGDAPPVWKVQHSVHRNVWIGVIAVLVLVFVLFRFAV